MNIILYLFNYIKYQPKIIGQLLNFIYRYIPLNKWAFDDSHFPKYRKFNIAELPKIISFKQALIDLYNITISHQTIANYCKNWGYQVSDNRGIRPYIVSMRMAFKHLKVLQKNCKFIAYGYSAYPLATQQFFHESKGKINFNITQIIGLTNNDEVSKEFPPFEQMIKRLHVSDE